MSVVESEGEIAALRAELGAALLELETERRRACRAVLVTSLGLLVATFVVLGAAIRGAWLLHEDAPEASSILVFAAVIGWALVAGFLYRRFGGGRRTAYARSFKERIWTAVCSARFPELRYVPGGGLSYEIFDRADLFPWPSDTYASEDRFEGRIGSIELILADVTAHRAVWRRDSDGVHTAHERYFRGIFLVADRGHPCRGEVRVLPRRARMRRLRGEVAVPMGDPEVDERLTVFATDPGGAQELLAPELGRSLARLSGRWSHDLRLVFRDRYVYVAAPRPFDSFEPRLTRSVLDPDVIAPFLADLEPCIELVRAIDRAG